MRAISTESLARLPAAVAVGPRRQAAAPARSASDVGVGVSTLCRALIPCLLLGTIACADRAAGVPSSTVRDSAGIHISESSAPSWADDGGWTLSPEPVQQLGVVDGAPEYQLDGVVGAAVKSDGTLVVADGGSGEIRMYDPSGTHLRTLGGRGSGPGEFQAIRWMGLHQDSIFVWDSRSKRLTVYTADGELARSFAPEALSSAFSPSALGVLMDGTLVATPGDSPAAMMSAPEGEYRGTWVYLALGPEAPRVDTVASLPGGERWLQKSENRFTSMDIVFGRDTHIAVAGDYVYAGDSDRFEVTGYRADGSIGRIVRRAHEPVAVTEAEVVAEMERRIATLPTDPPSVREGMRAAMLEPAPKSTLPAFTDLLADSEGNLWVRESTPTEDAGQIWSVFDREGRWLGTVEMPADLRVRQITADRVVGTWRDELDVEYVRLHELSKP